MTYRNTSGLIAVHELALVDESWLSRALIELGLAVPLLVHLDVCLCDAVCIAVATLLRLCDLLFDATPDVFEVWWVARLDHVIGGQHRAFSDQTQFFAKLQVGRIGRLVVVEEHEIDVLQLSRLMQASDRFIAGANDDLDNVRKTCQIDKRHDHCGKCRITLQTEVPLPSGFAKCIAEQNTRVANVATKLNLGLSVS